MIPTQISFRGMTPSDAVSEDVQSRVDKLERHFSHIQSCRVVVSIPHRHHSKGKIFHVQITLNVPLDCLVVSRESEKDKSHDDIYIAIHDAFHALTKRLEEYADRIRHVQKEKFKLSSLFISDMNWEFT